MKNEEPLVLKQCCPCDWCKKNKTEQCVKYMEYKIIRNVDIVFKKQKGGKKL